MSLRPEDVEQVMFNKPVIGRRGYDESEVDAFLDLVQAELTSSRTRIDDLIRHNDDLRRENEQLRAQLGQR